MPKLGGGYSLERNDNLIIPIQMTNDNEFKEVMARESVFSFPMAAAGTVMAGPAGTVAGHVAGTAMGAIRHKRIHPDQSFLKR